MPCAREAVSEEYVQYIIDFDLTSEEIDTSGVDFCSVEVGNGINIVYIRAEDVNKIARYLEQYSYLPKCYGLMQEGIAGGIGNYAADAPNINLQPLEASGILRVQGRPLSLTGRDVIIGFIDTGIRYDLPHFRNEDGTTRILSIWDQTLDAGELGQNGMSYAPPEEFDYGVEFVREQIDEALRSGSPYELVPTTDENGHGTKMASVAAGSYLENGFRGAAYECDMVVVKLRQSPRFLREFYQIPDGEECYSDPDMMLAIKYIQSFSRVFRRPIVFCLGLGTSFGDHSGQSLLSKYIDSVAVTRNQAFIIAGGNEGNAAGHFHGEIPLRSEKNWVDCELLIGERQQGFVMELWGKMPDNFSVEIVSPTGETIPRLIFRQGQSVQYHFVYSNTDLTIYYRVVEKSSGDQLILMRFENPLAGIWMFRVYGEGESGMAEFDMWLPIEQFLSRGTAFLRPDADTTLTEPAYARNAISVSTYQSINNSFYINSGRGFAADGFIQPDIAAPGVGITTALGTESGSSMAAAITAGAVADFMQWAVIGRNDLLVNTESLRNYLVRGASRDEGLSYPNNSWGYGRLNLSGTFDRIAGITSTR